MIADLAVTSSLGSSFDYNGLDGNGMVLVQSLWKLCDHFVPLCAFVIICCDIF
jgi:hypothetical protein